MGVGPSIGGFDELVEHERSVLGRESECDSGDASDYSPIAVCRLRVCVSASWICLCLYA